MLPIFDQKRRRETMSKHRHEECCYPMMGGGYGYGMAGYGYGGGGTGIRWIYALLILIVIVLQFGRRRERCNNLVGTNVCEDGLVNNRANCCDDDLNNNEAIDRSVLFIIVIFLLIICAGCFNQGGAGGHFGGFGY
jgi:hypothetical protein